MTPIATIFLAGVVSLVSAGAGVAFFILTLGHVHGSRAECLAANPNAVCAIYWMPEPGVK